jgi:hypothetical protein
MIGQNSPLIPLPRTAEPSGVASRAGVGEDGHERADRGRAQRDPDQPPGVVESRSSSQTARRAIASDTIQPTVPSPIRRRGTRFSITSIPATKRMDASPRPANTAVWELAFAR